MKFDFENGLFVLNDEQIPVIEMTNDELRQSIIELNDFIIDTDGYNDEFIELLQEELIDRGESFSPTD